MVQTLPISFYRLFLWLGLSISTTAWAQDNQILGKWVNDEQHIVLEIYREGDSYNGKIAWQQTGQTIAKVSTASQESPASSVQPLQGATMLANFMYSATNKMWENGTFYDHQRERTYSCQMWLNEDQSDLLYIRSYVGFPFWGTTTVWQRPNANHPVYGRSTSSRHWLGLVSVLFSSVNIRYSSAR